MMATSSIFASFNIKDSKTAEAFVAALDASANDPKRTPEAPTPHVMTDKKQILEFFSKGLKKTDE